MTWANSPAVGIPLSMTCAGTGAWISVSQSSHTHLPRTWHSTANTPGVIEQLPSFLRTQQRHGLLRKLRRRIEKRLDKQWDKLREAMADPDHDRHRLRLLIKRVRYAAEAYPALSHQPDGLLKRLKAAQGALGDWHDHLQWLAQAEQHADLSPCVSGWQLGIRRAETQSDKALKRLFEACFGRKQKH